MGAEPQTPTEPGSKPVAEMRITFEPPVSKEDIRQRCQAIADRVEEMQDD